MKPLRPVPRLALALFCVLRKGTGAGFIFTRTRSAPRHETTHLARFDPRSESPDDRARRLAVLGGQSRFSKAPGPGYCSFFDSLQIENPNHLWGEIGAPTLWPCPKNFHPVSGVDPSIAG
jgi:hypothetical protein